MLHSTNPVVQNAIVGAMRSRMIAQNADKKIAEKAFGPCRVVVYDIGGGKARANFIIQDKDWDDASYGESDSDINWTAKDINSMPQTPLRRKLEGILAYARRAQSWVRSNYPAAR